jgi:hypothetical protein
VADLDLAAIEARARAATPGPLHVRWLDDDRSMNVVAIATTPETGLHEQLAVDVPADEIVALTLYHGLAQRDDGWDADAALFAHARADVLALAAALRRLRWCAVVCARRHIPEPDPLLAHVTPAALERWLAAHGWAVVAAARWHTVYRRPEDEWTVQVPLRTDFDDYGQRVLAALERIQRVAGLPSALVLAELLPAHGPWEVHRG